MKIKPFAPKVDVLEQFNYLAEHDAPRHVDFSERIMHQIQTDPNLTGNNIPIVRTRKRSRVAFTMATIITSVVILSGFTYAAVEGWLSLKDNSGNTIMEVNHTDVKVLAQDNQILDTLKSNLQPKEAATVVFGKEIINAVKRGEFPKYSSTISRGSTYTTTQALIPHLLSVMSHIKLPSDTIQGATLTEAALVYETNGAIVSKSDPWIEMIDPKTGTLYAYQISSTTDKSSLVEFTYKDNDMIYKLSISGNDQSTVKFFDSNASSSQIHDVAGTQVYNYIDPDNKEDNRLVWSHQVVGGSLFYSLMSTPVDTTKKIAFAKSIIGAYSSEK